MKAQIKDLQKALEQLPSQAQPSNAPVVDIKVEPGLIIKSEPTVHGYPEVRCKNKSKNCESQPSSSKNANRDRAHDKQDKCLKTKVEH